MKPLIFVLSFFTCAWAGAQGRFVQAAYVNYIQDGNFCGWVTNYNYAFFIYSDSTVRVEVQTSQNSLFRNESYVHSIYNGKCQIHDNILNISYIDSRSKDTDNKKIQLKRYYIPSPNERIFYPPTIFIIKGETIKDLNSDFPVLNKVSPAVAMNMPQPK